MGFVRSRSFFIPAFLVAASLLAAPQSLYAYTNDETKTAQGSSPNPSVDISFCHRKSGGQIVYKRADGNFVGTPSIPRILNCIVSSNPLDCGVLTALYDDTYLKEDFTIYGSANPSAGAPDEVITDVELATYTDYGNGNLVSDPNAIKFNAAGVMINAQHNIGSPTLGAWNPMEPAPEPKPEEGGSLPDYP